MTPLEQVITAVLERAAQQTGTLRRLPVSGFYVANGIKSRTDPARAAAAAIYTIPVSELALELAHLMPDASVSADPSILPEEAENQRAVAALIEAAKQADDYFLSIAPEGLPENGARHWLHPDCRRVWSNIRTALAKFAGDFPSAAIAAETRLVTAAQIEAALGALRDGWPDMMDLFMRGQCMTLFLHLRHLIPDAQAWYSSEEGHVYIKAAGRFWDIRGPHTRLPKDLAPLIWQNSDKPHRWASRDRRRLTIPDAAAARDLAHLMPGESVEITGTPDRIWAWSFNDWDNWGGYARHTNRFPLDDKERKTGAEYIRADLAHPSDAESLRAEVERLKAERDALAAQALRDRKSANTAMSDAIMWQFSVADGAHDGQPLLVKVWRQRKAIEADLAAAQARVRELEAESTTLKATIQGLRSQTTRMMEDHAAIAPPDAEQDALVARLEKLADDMERCATDEWDESEDVRKAITALRARKGGA